jgi:hypothetical protein
LTDRMLGVLIVMRVRVRFVVGDEATLEWASGRFKRFLNSSLARSSVDRQSGPPADTGDELKLTHACTEN